jgi:outer membrane protein assembly factor BamB
MRCLLPLSLFVVASLATGLTGAAGQEWTRFRGPNGTGQSEATTIPAHWGSGDYNWVVELPGVGHSSPVVWGQRLFVQSAEPDNSRRYVLCLDTADGSTLWQHEIASHEYPIHRFSSYASSTPAVDADHVYVAWATPEQLSLRAYDHDGNTVWNRDDLGPFPSQHGFGVSPIVAGQLVILCNQQAAPVRDQPVNTSSILAFDRRSGELRWKTPRISASASYAVPCLRNPAGGPELIICNTAQGMFALDLETGHENWSIPVFSMRTVSSPVVVGDLVFGSTGSGGGGNYVVAVRPGPSGPKEVYRVEQPAPYVPCPVAHGDLVFLWYDGGIVSCIDAHTGERHWRKRVGGNYFASPVRAADRIYGVSEAGDVVVLAASREYQFISRNPLGESSRSTPAIAGGRMYLRSFSKLFSLGG